jgi:hypothetical protein
MCVMLTAVGNSLIQSKTREECAHSESERWSKERLAFPGYVCGRRYDLVRKFALPCPGKREACCVGIFRLDVPPAIGTFDDGDGAANGGHGSVSPDLGLSFNGSVLPGYSGGLAECSRNIFQLWSPYFRFIIRSLTAERRGVFGFGGKRFQIRGVNNCIHRFFSLLCHHFWSPSDIWWVQCVSLGCECESDWKFIQDLVGTCQSFPSDPSS